MIDFFKYENYQLFLNLPEILLVKEFSDVLDWDKSKNKEKAFEVFKYIWLKHHWKSPYRAYSAKELDDVLQKDSKLTEKEKELAIVKAAEQQFIRILDSNMKLKTARRIKDSINNFLQYFESFNMTEKVAKGAKAGQLSHSPKEYLDVVRNVTVIFDQIDTLDNIISEELSQDQNIRGTNQVADHYK